MRPSTDWRDRFRTRSVLWTTPAKANRRRALAVSTRTGVMQLYSWDVETNELTQLTDRAEGAYNGAISGDGRWLFVFDDRQGDERGHWRRIAWPAAEPAAEPTDLTPDLPLYTSEGLATSADGETIAFAASHGDTSVVYVLTRDDAPREVYRSPHIVELAGFDASGQRLGVLTNERSGLPRFALLVIDVASGERVAELWEGPDSSIGYVHFSPVGGRAVLASDVSGALRPSIWDPQSGRRDEIEVLEEGETVPWDWSPDGSSILLGRVANARQQLFVFEPDSGRLRRLDTPPGVYGFFGGAGCWFTHDGDIVAQWQDSTNPSTTVLLDGQTGALKQRLLEPTPVPESRTLRSVTFTVDGGQPIQAWLATPAGEGPFPAVIETHGGPESVTMESFQPRAQAWLDHGFCFLTINYRGSTTFGREFKEAIWGRIGELEVRDIVAGRQWLLDHGVARPDEVFLTGWSYGGYLTLHALGTAPGLWAGGMAGIAIADWVTQYEDENDMLRAYDRAIFGGAPEDDLDAYRRASPITYAEQVDAPVLIMQGRNDTRCPARQVELYEARLRKLGKPIEVIWYDAGHAGAGADVEQFIRFQERMLEFAQRVLEERRAGPAGQSG